MSSTEDNLDLENFVEEFVAELLYRENKVPAHFTPALKSRFHPGLTNGCA